MSTYTPIASITTASSVANVVFTGIPQTYTDLVLTAAGTLSASTAATLRFNNDTSNNYSISYLYGNGTGSGGVGGASEGPQSVADVFYFDATTQNAGVVNIMNYSSTATKKTVISRANGAESLVISYVALWQQTAAINSITIQTDSGTISAGMTFNLYGVADAGITNTAKAIGGDIVTTDGTYWYHGFLASGTFTPTQSINADVLVVAGGGGGSSGGGGGGAGGLFYSATNSLSTTSYTVTVGAGGSGAFENKGTNGSNSQFGALTAAVGGGTGGTDYISGLGPESGNTGGSGGGAAQNPTAGGTFGTGTAGQGNNGGTGSMSASAYGGGGGGGAGAVGGNGSGSIGGNGGAGLSTYSSWGAATSTGQNVSGTYWFAGGGAGGTNTGGTRATGGNGGGGNGGLGTAQPGFAGTANTGGGGGASSGGAAGGTSAAGGSGIVIVRYAV